MAWKPGESGNPEGAKRHRLWIATLERAIKAEDGKRLRDAAEKLLTKAAEGEPWAIKELGDRLDGKARQQIEAVDDQGRTLAIGLVAYANNPPQVPAEAVPAPRPEGA
jgi:hypothetical protein